MLTLTHPNGRTFTCAQEKPVSTTDIMRLALAFMNDEMDFDQVTESIIKASGADLSDFTEVEPEQETIEKQEAYDAQLVSEQEITNDLWQEVVVEADEQDKGQDELLVNYNGVYFPDKGDDYTVPVERQKLILASWEHLKNSLRDAIPELENLEDISKPTKNGYKNKSAIQLKKDKELLSTIRKDLNANVLKLFVAEELENLIQTRVNGVYRELLAKKSDQEEPTEEENFVYVLAQNKHLVPENIPYKIVDSVLDIPNKTAKYIDENGEIGEAIYAIMEAKHTPKPVAEAEPSVLRVKQMQKIERLKTDPELSEEERARRIQFAEEVLRHIR